MGVTAPHQLQCSEWSCLPGLSNNRVCDVEQAAVRHKGRIVDQDINGTEARACPVDQGIQIFGNGDVAFNIFCLPAARFDYASRFGKCRRSAPAQHNARASTGQRQSDAATDAVPAASDDGNLAMKGKDYLAGQVTAPAGLPGCPSQRKMTAIAIPIDIAAMP